MGQWALAEDEARDKAMQSIITRFCQQDSESCLSYLTGDTVLRYRAVSEKDFEAVMACQVKDATRNFLKGQPFFEYQRSPSFQKYLQWKEFEKQKITDIRPTLGVPDIRPRWFWRGRCLTFLQFTLSRKEYELQFLHIFN